jgi:glycosyltransferase involved in cell wall biosynthesis
VVVPSLVEETGGLTAVEALAAGVPVVASSIGGLTDAVTHGKNGLLFEAGNAEELAAALRLLVSNKDYYLQLKSNAKHEKTFEEFIGELEAIYEEIMVGAKEENQ